MIFFVFFTVELYSTHRDRAGIKSSNVSYVSTHSLLVSAAVSVMDSNLCDRGSSPRW